MKYFLGQVECTMVQKLYTGGYSGCNGAPNLFDPTKYDGGPRLGTDDGTYFYWDSSSQIGFPIHNPCNSYTPPSNINYTNPIGSIYLQ